MQKAQNPPGRLVIVCDGKKALTWRMPGDDKIPQLKTREVQEHADRRRPISAPMSRPVFSRSEADAAR
jgi:protein required for attachment to host cells